LEVAWLVLWSCKAIFVLRLGLVWQVVPPVMSNPTESFSYHVVVAQMSSSNILQQLTVSFTGVI